MKDSWLNGWTICSQSDELSNLAILMKNYQWTIFSYEFIMDERKPYCSWWLSIYGDDSTDW